MEATHPTPRETTDRGGPADVHGRLDLDALAKLDSNALRRLYTSAAAPKGVAALEGHPRGRMLAVHGFDHGLPAGVVRALASAAFFPWGGKSFAGRGEHGTGVNRVHAFGRHQLFPFATSVQPSAVDGAPCIALDYDLPDNPALIRAIHDEVREVAPGLYLGPAMWKGTHGKQLVLWFGLDARSQARPVGAARNAA